MNPYEKDRYKDKEFFEVLFEKIFESIKKTYISDNIEEFMQDTNDEQFRPNRNFVQGFDLNIASHGEINAPRSENDGPVFLDGKHEKSEKSDFPIDIMETDEEIFVTVNIPGIEKEDIVLNVTDDSLEITINAFNLKYHKAHKLPCNVKPKETRSSYKNGVLDIIMKRKGKKNTEGKYKANVD